MHAAPSRTEGVRLREVRASDLATFFEHQSDPVAVSMAAFPAPDREAFLTHWRSRILGDPNVIKKTIIFEDKVAGSIICFKRANRYLIGYWIDRALWSKGIATAALSELLTELAARPLHAYVAKQNTASIRVLQKCGFRPTDEERTASSTSECAADEFVFELTR